MRSLVVIACIALAAAPASAQAPSGGDHPLLHQIGGDVSEARLQATIGRLVGFGTRHTASDTRSNTLGIGAARRWVRREFESMGRACDGCLTIATPSDTVTGERLTAPTEIADVLAIQRGTSEPDRVVIISAHLDSRVTDVMNATADAPGADDDGSGVAAVLEAARVLSQRRFPATIVYAVTSGEEQGLYGGTILANYAKAQNWRVEADLNNDIVGGVTSAAGVTDREHVRVFSEGTRATETQAEADRRRYNGGEVDSPARNLARFIDVQAARYLPGFGVRMIYRTDRYGRGGDQVPMAEAGFPAVRFSEARENYNREHQDVWTENGVAYGDVVAGIDFPYLAQVTRLNAVTLAALAMAPAPPSGVRIEGAVSEDTTAHWTKSAGAAGYCVWRRETTAAQWQTCQAAGDADQAALRGVVIDDWFFGVSAISADGYESPVVFPGAAGAFFSAPTPAPSR